MDLLTPSINVPAERSKLRRLRNEINADAQARLAYQRNYTARGYRRTSAPSTSRLRRMWRLFGRLGMRGGEAQWLRT